MQNDIVRRAPADSPATVKPPVTNQAIAIPAAPGQPAGSPRTEINQTETQQAQPQNPPQIQPQAERQNTIAAEEPASTAAVKDRQSRLPYMVISVAIGVCLALVGITVYLGIQSGYVPVN